MPYNAIKRRDRLYKLPVPPLYFCFFDSPFPSCTSSYSDAIFFDASDFMDFTENTHTRIVNMSAAGWEK